MGMKNKMLHVLQAKWNRDYQKKLAKCRVEIDYHTFTENQKDPSKVVRVNHDQLKFRDIALFISKRGEMDPNAYAKIQMYMSAHPECKILYGDEDVDGDTPVFRGSFGREEWLQTYGMGSLVAVDKALDPNLENEIVYDRPEEVRNLLHSLLNQAGAFQVGNKAVAHISEVLFHAAGLPGEKMEELPQPMETMQLHRLSVVIPSKDHPEILKQCIDTLSQSPCSLTMEILVVDNGSSEENKSVLEKYLETKQDGSRIILHYLYEKEDFNFSKMCNKGAKAATGDVLLFLNDDVEATQTDWLEKMLSLAAKPYVGAVGSKLYYPGGRKVQHLGVQNLPGGPVHKFQFMEEDDSFYSLERKNVLAVTGACLMVRKNLFEEAGGFPENLQVAYNDVALCMALHRKGYENVVCTKNTLYHHESLSRGNDLSVEKLKRLKRERNTLYAEYPEYRGRDPYYSEYLSHELGDASINPRFFEIRENQQKAGWKKVLLPEVTKESLELKFDLTTKQGYGVVLFENNAFFERYLIAKGQQGNCFCMKLQEQYSEETAFWMQEQPNCALCGFQIGETLELLPSDQYELGLLMKRKIGRKSYFDWFMEEGKILTYTKK